ncbi:DnaJ C-terminal domain-containing protein [Fodinicurvata sp. EGI_FJ10296]|uniref:DnaJ C-terminal domain-containing protein n=1 Tax=Fodinicurvata sp. EGI_FJ10296 TaxID=3231908 RepID=UPI003456136A
MFATLSGRRDLGTEFDAPLGNVTSLSKQSDAATAMRDPYRILGLTRNAAPDEVKQAYRRLVKEVHPDLHPGDPSMERRFKEVAGAYALLGDPDKRSRYDRGLIDAEGRPLTRGWRSWRGPGPHTRTTGGSPEAARRSANDSGSGDRTAKETGTNDPGAGSQKSGRQSSDQGTAGGARRSFSDLFRRMAGKDVQYDLVVPFVDAAAGGKQRLTLSDGRTITVAIPAGATTDQVLRLKGQGLKGMGGGTPGDALVTLTVAPHSHFRRDGSTIHLLLPITLKEAILGGTVDTPTVHGRVALKVPTGSSSGRVLRLRGKGVMDRVTGEWGDQLVTLELILPDPPDPALKALIEGWNPPKNYDPRGDAGF